MSNLQILPSRGIKNTDLEDWKKNATFALENDNNQRLQIVF